MGDIVKRKRKMETLKTEAFRDEVVYLVSSRSATLAEIAEEQGVTPNMLTKWLREDHPEDYEAMMLDRAQSHVDEMEAAIDDVEKGNIEPAAFKAAASARQWLAQRWSPEQYGDRTKLEVQHKHIHELHIQAVRELARKDREAIEGEIIQDNQLLGDLSTVSSGEELL